MRIILFLLIAIILANATEDVKQDSTVVLELLWTLNQRTFYSLQSLQNSYQKADQAKKEFVESLKSTLNEQKQQCARKFIAIQEKQKQIEEVTNYVQWASAKQQQNALRREILSGTKCTSYQNFVNNIKNTRISENLITYLKKAISSLEAEHLTLLQRDSFLQKVSVFIQKLTEKNIQELMTLADSIEEIQLENKESRELTTQEKQKFTETKQELMQILNELDDSSEKGVDGYQFNVIRSKVTMQRFNDQLSKEDQFLVVDGEEQKQELENLNNQMITLNRQYNDCENKIEELKRSFELAKHDRKQNTESYNAQKEKLSEQQKLFDELHVMYKEQVDSQINQ